MWHRTKGLELNNYKLKRGKYVVGQLDVLCWAASAGGEHYTGKIKFYCFEEGHDPGDIEMVHPLTAKEAKYLNKKDETREHSRYKPGDLNERFESREQIYRFAKEEFSKRYPNGVLIVEYYYWVLCWPKEETLRAKCLNELAEEYQRIGFWEGNRERAEEIDDEWHKIADPMIYENS